MTEDQVRAILEETGACQHGHFLLSSGLHSDQYVQCALLLQHPQHAATLCAELADRFRDARATTVAAPAIGGILVAYEVARALGVRGLFAEREDGAFRLRRGFSVQAGERVLLVEDVLTTGQSARAVMDLIRATGADVVGLGCLVDRRTEEMPAWLPKGIPCRTLLRFSAAAVPAEACDLCRQGRPLIKPGSRR